jgi:paraquat-inducible protein B
MVQVSFGLNKKTLENLGLRPPGLPREKVEPLPPDLRAEIGSEGLLGAKFIALDFVNTEKSPLPVLSFAPPERYVPASTSPGLEASLGKAADGLAQLIDSLNRAGFSDKLASVAGHADAALGDLDQILQGLQHQNVPEKTGAALAEVRAAVAKARSALERVDGDNGLVATAQHTFVTFGDVGRNASKGTANLDEVLDEFRATAASIRLLADQLEQDPDMLLKGRAHAKTP